MGKNPHIKAGAKPPAGTLVVAGLFVLFAVLGGAGYWFIASSKKLPEYQRLKHEEKYNYEEPQSVAYRGYAGSESCKDCHQQAYTNWLGSHHALAERPLNEAQDKPAFVPTRSFQHGTQTSSVAQVQGRYEITTKGLGGEQKVFKAERVIGENPLRQYLVANGGGRLQVTEVASDPRTNDWFDVYGNEDRQPGEWGHWTGRGMTWNVMCANCHNTRLRKNFLPENDTYSTSMVEMGVGCEACHGPLADHVVWQKRFPLAPGQKRDPQHKDPTLKTQTKDQIRDTCATCHARRGELTGDFKPGDRFSDHHMLVIPDETDTFYPDGQVRDEDYEFTAFLGSRMHSSKVRCIDCHEPHLAKRRLQGNALCLTCHSAPIPPAPKVNPATHSHHKIGTAGDLCTDCHMPITSYMVRHQRHDHGFTIPDPLLTKQFNIPNACNRCHTKTNETVQWSIDYVDKWYGKKMDRPYRQRSTVLAQARNGDHNSVPGLIKLMQEEKIPMWRASAVLLSRHWINEPPVAAAIIGRAKDADPLVRSVAARSLEALLGQPGSKATNVLQSLLTDTSRVVRVEAAWALHATVDANSTAGKDLLRYLTHNVDQPSGLMQMGVYTMDRGNNADALAYFQKAVQWDEGSAPLRHALAICESVNGRMQEAVKQLEAACRLAPREATYRFQLGLAYNEANRLKDAAASMEEAVKLDPQYTQAWYNLGLARNAIGNPDGALEALSKAESLSPTSPQIPYARATILARQERLREAKAAANRALEIMPGYPDAMALLQQLSARP